MDIIEVTAGKWNEPTFDTAAEAIVYRSARAQRAADDSLLMSGAAIDSARYTDTELRLWLSDGRTFRIYLDGKRVEWEFLVRNVPTDESWDERAPCVLRFVNSQLDDSVWDRPSLLEQRVGCSLGGIWTGKKILFLYVARTRSLMFGALERLPEGTPLLHWDETH